MKESTHNLILTFRARRSWLPRSYLSLKGSRRQLATELKEERHWKGRKYCQDRELRMLDTRSSICRHIESKKIDEIDYSELEIRMMDLYRAKGSMSSGVKTGRPPTPEPPPQFRPRQQAPAATPHSDGGGLANPT